MFRPIVSVAPVSPLHFPYVTTMTSWRKRCKGEKTSAVNNYVLLCICTEAFQGSLHPKFQSCLRKHVVRKEYGFGGGVFIAISPCLVLAHCFCLAHLPLVSPFSLIPSPSPPPPYFFPSRTVPVSLCEYCGVSLKSTDMGAVGLGRRATATPLPHPEQLLILCNRIISAKAAALFRSREHGKQTKRTSFAETEMQKGAKDTQQQTVQQFDPDITHRSDGFSDEFRCECIDPALASAQPSVLTFQRTLTV